jgi:hypothetical protein
VGEQDGTEEEEDGLSVTRKSASRSDGGDEIVWRRAVAREFSIFHVNLFFSYKMKINELTGTVVCKERF